MIKRPAATASGMTSVLELEKRGHYSRALRLVDALLSMEGQSADLLAAKARLLNSQGRLTDALRTGDLAADLWPTSASGHAARAETLEAAERHADAIAAADRALALDARDVVALRTRAVALAETHRPGEATPAARQALELAPEDPDCLMALATVLLEVDPPAALREISPHVERHRTAATLAVRGMVRTQLGDLPGAEADVREAVSLDPDNEAALLTAMLADLTAERWDDVIAGAESPLIRDNVLAALLAGHAYQSSSRPADAEKALVLVVDQQPMNLAAWTMLRAAQLDLGAWRELALTCSRILALVPDDDVTLTIRARASCELDNPAAAVRDLDRVLDRDPGDWPALAIRSVAHLMLERPAQALADADAALAAGAESDSLAPTARMLALLGLGRRREAEETARRILRVRPGQDVAQRIVQAADARWKARLDTFTDLAKAALQIVGS